MGGTDSKPTPYPPNTPPTSSLTTLHNQPLNNTYFFYIPTICTKAQFHPFACWNARRFQYIARNFHDEFELSVQLAQDTRLKNSTTISGYSQSTHRQLFPQSTSRPEVPKLSYLPHIPLVITPVGSQVHPCYTNEAVQQLSQLPPPSELWCEHCGPSLENPEPLKPKPSATAATSQSRFGAKAAATSPSPDDELPAPKVLAGLESDPFFQSQIENYSKCSRQTLLTAKQVQIQPILSPYTHTAATGTSYQLASYRTFAKHKPPKDEETTEMLHLLFGQECRIFEEYEASQKVNEDSSSPSSPSSPSLKSNQSNVHHKDHPQNYVLVDPRTRFTVFAQSLQITLPLRTDYTAMTLHTALEPVLLHNPHALIPFFCFCIDVNSESSIEQFHLALDQIIISRNAGLLTKFSPHDTPLIFILTNTHYDTTLLSESDISTFCADLYDFHNLVFYHHTTITTPGASRQTTYHPEQYKADVKLVNFLDELLLRFFCDQIIIPPIHNPPGPVKFSINKTTLGGSGQTIYRSQPTFPPNTPLFNKYAAFPRHTIVLPGFNRLCPKINPLWARTQYTRQKLTTPLITSVDDPFGTRSRPYKLHHDGFVVTLFRDDRSHHGPDPTGLLKLVNAPRTFMMPTSAQPKPAGNVDQKPVCKMLYGFAIAKHAFDPLNSAFSIPLYESQQAQGLQAHSTDTSTEATKDEAQSKTTTTNSDVFVPPLITQEMTNPCHYQQFLQIRPSFMHTCADLMKTRFLSFPSAILHPTAPMASPDFYSPDDALKKPTTTTTTTTSSSFVITPPSFISTAQLHTVSAKIPQQVYSIFRPESSEQQANNKPPDPVQSTLFDSSVDFIDSPSTEFYSSNMLITLFNNSLRNHVEEFKTVMNENMLVPHKYSFGAFVVDLSVEYKRSDPLFESACTPNATIVNVIEEYLAQLTFTPYTIWLFVVIPAHFTSIENMQRQHPAWYDILIKPIKNLTPKQSQRKSQYNGNFTLSPCFVTPTQAPAAWEFILRQSIAERLHLINIVNYIHDHPDCL